MNWLNMKFFIEFGSASSPGFSCKLERKVIETSRYRLYSSILCLSLSQERKSKKLAIKIVIVKEKRICIKVVTDKFFIVFVSTNY